ncbi:gp026 [Rhodococcus phage ReqiPepy6]|uniref:Gp026 n=1 Tax=Rhodococcus phage ReqiPepy6 TaxID=691965 RepID=D4P7D7_9CAUD|nr:gp026 [Rhodococcus phage ReqiPepy6]ADD80917.1 gp026 [Rhodococcus phage ReqiPepy6]
MAKFCGVVGYANAVESPLGSGIWVDQVVERKYYGDVVRTARSLREGENLHDDITVSNSISIVADAYARNHFINMLYVQWSGARWVVSNVDATSPPRLVLQLGGIYNGETPDATPGTP